MKYLQTKHEKNSAQITALITLIIVLLLFFVSSPPYTDPPEEYGVALNFGDPAEIQNPIEPSIPSSPQESKIVEQVEEIKEEVIEEIVEEQPVEEIIEEIEEIKDKAEEDLLTQEAEDAIKIKEAEEKAKKEALKVKEAKEKSEAELVKVNAAKARAEKEAKEKADALAKSAADKAAADKAAKAKADGLAKAAAAKAAREKATSNFNAKESSPIYPGCQNGTLAQRESCTKSKLRQFLADNFNKELAGEVGLSGVQSIKIVLSIDNKGTIVNSRALAKHPKLVEEVKRVVKLYPRLIPALQNGKPSAYNFSLSISIQTGK